MPLTIPRLIQVWAYTTTLGRLLLRATASAELPTRIDVLFQNVWAIKLPMIMTDAVIRRAEPHERDAILSEVVIDDPETLKFFVVEGRAFGGWVVAGSMRTHEDSGTYDDPSPLWEG